MEWWAMFAWGLIGGIAPEIIRAYRILIETIDFYYPKKLILISAVLAILGGFIAIAFESSSPLNAILIGFATPTIVSTYAGTSPQTTIGYHNKNRS
jgi:uncharacterized membrane protein